MTIGRTKHVVRSTPSQPRAAIALSGMRSFLIPFSSLRAVTSTRRGALRRCTATRHRRTSYGHAIRTSIRPAPSSRRIAACIPIPDIPFVKVKITSSADKSNFGTETIDAQKNEFTQQITFTATASDEAGQPLGGASVHWFRSGIEFGTGTSLTTALPSGATVVPITIKVTAFGETTSASDQIQINVGTVKSIGPLDSEFTLFSVREGRPFRNIQLCV